LSASALYVDTFCGRVTHSVLARHYMDFSPERLKEIYDKMGLRILERCDESSSSASVGLGENR